MLSPGPNEFLRVGIEDCFCVRPQELTVIAVIFLAFISIVVVAWQYMFVRPVSICRSLSLYRLTGNCISSTLGFYPSSHSHVRFFKTGSLGPFIGWALFPNKFCQLFTKGKVRIQAFAHCEMPHLDISLSNRYGYKRSMRIWLHCTNSALPN